MSANAPPNLSPEQLASIQYQMEHWDDDRRPTVVFCAWFLYGLAVLAVALRFYAKSMVRNGFRIEDGLILLGLVRDAVRENILGTDEFPRLVRLDLQSRIPLVSLESPPSMRLILTMVAVVDGGGGVHAVRAGEEAILTSIRVCIQPFAEFQLTRLDFVCLPNQLLLHHILHKSFYSGLLPPYL